MARFHDDRDEVVTEGIDGLLRTTPDLARLDGSPDVKVVLRPDRDPQQVAIISGGGSGHEPAHAGYVGDGTLTGPLADPVAGLERGIEVVERYGGASQGDRTALDALVPAAEALDGGDVDAAAQAAEEGAAATATMGDAKAGRSAYVRADALDGVRDPGAAAVARILGAVATSLG